VLPEEGEKRKEKKKITREREREVVPPDVRIPSGEILRLVSVSVPWRGKKRNDAEEKRKNWRRVKAARAEAMIGMLLDPEEKKKKGGALRTAGKRARREWK